MEGPVVTETDRVHVRLAELVAALSLGIDLGFGQPMEARAPAMPDRSATSCAACGWRPLASVKRPGGRVQRSHALVGQPV